MILFVWGEDNFPSPRKHMSHMARGKKIILQMIYFDLDLYGESSQLSLFHQP